MGMNLSIVTRDFRDHPRWDSGRHAGDRDVAVYLADADGTVTVGEERDLFRPADIGAKLPEMIRLAGCNDDRWKMLVEIIENEPDYWLYIGW